MLQDEDDEDDKPSLKETTQINEDMTGLREANITSIGVPASANNDEECGLMGQFSSHLQHQSKKAKNDIPTTNLENSISLPQQPGNKVVPSIRDPVVVQQMCQPKPTPGNYEKQTTFKEGNSALHYELQSIFFACQICHNGNGSVEYINSKT